MDSSRQKITIDDVERRYRVGLFWWTERVAFLLTGSAVVFVLALVHGVVSATLLGVFTIALMNMVFFRGESFFFGRMYRIGGFVGAHGGVVSWVEQPGTTYAHTGLVMLKVRVPGLFVQRRYVLACDDYAIGSRPVMVVPWGQHEGKFQVARRSDGTLTASHLEGIVFLLVNDYWQVAKPK